MPIKLRFHLDGPDPGSLYRHATGLRAVVLDWVRRADPDLSQQIHDANQAKPFRIGPLLWEENCAMFEVAVLADDVLPPLVRGMQSAGKAVRLGNQLYRLSEWQTFDEKSWQQLLAPLPAAREFGFRIESPAAHHASGELRKSIVLPSPELYFGSWLGRWNLCSPLQLDSESIRALVEAQVAIKMCEGGTRAVILDKGRPFIGFQGTVWFTLLKPETVAPEYRTALAALCRFAGYCGTGVDTMRGMGQTAPIAVPDDR